MTVAPPAARWWESAAGITRPPLKTGGCTLRDLIDGLDELQQLGFDAIEVFAPCAGGTAYGGLDTIDFYRVDAAIGTMADFRELVAEGHARGIAIVPFLNAGYVHESYPAFLRACDDMARGEETDDTRLFLWSDSPEAELAHPLTEHFLQGSDGRWHWCERAKSWFWVKWEGDDGTLALPQLNWADPGWQREAAHIVDFWLATGADGIVIDAVNWYIGCDWPAIRAAVTDRHPDVFTHPEGAGGFGDDPVPWISDGGFTVLMDYGLKIWWDDIDVVRDAVLGGDHASIEAALRRFRDPVDAAGGACYINPPRMSSASRELRRLASAVVATVGELYFDGFGVASMSPALREVVAEMLHLRKAHPALAARGPRTVLHCDRPAVYSFIRGAGAERVLVALNFSDHDLVARWPLDELAQRDAGGAPVSVVLRPYDFQVIPLGDPTATA